MEPRLLPYLRYVNLYFIFALGLWLAACSAASASPDQLATTVPLQEEAPLPTEAAGEPTPTLVPAVVLPDLGPAPDFNNKAWLNTDGPLNLEALRGKAVLVEFWTFG